MAVHPPPRKPPASGPAGAPHSHPHHPAAPPRRRSRAVPVGLALAAAVGAGLLVWHGLSTHRRPQPEDVLLEQFHQAAAGTVESPHAFGGALTVEKANGRINVTAAALPSNACVQVGWQFAREGTVIINGVLPQRISGARLAELCALEPKGATLVWAPQ